MLYAQCALKKGDVIDVVWIPEKFARKGELLQARTRDFKTVLIHGDEGLIGSYLNVELTGTTGSAFTGQVVKDRQPLAVLA